MRSLQTIPASVVNTKRPTSRNVASPAFWKVQYLFKRKLLIAPKAKANELARSSQNVVRDGQSQSRAFRTRISINVFRMPTSPNRKKCQRVLVCRFFQQ